MLTFFILFLNVCSGGLHLNSLDYYCYNLDQLNIKFGWQRTLKQSSVFIIFSFFQKPEEKKSCWLLFFSPKMNSQLWLCLRIWLNNILKYSTYEVIFYIKFIALIVIYMSTPLSTLIKKDKHELKKIVKCKLIIFILITVDKVKM